MRQVAEFQTKAAIKIQSVDLLIRQAVEFQTEAAIKIQSVDLLIRQTETLLMRQTVEVQTKAAIKIQSVDLLIRQAAEVQTKAVIRTQGVNLLMRQVAEAQTEAVIRTQGVNLLMRQAAEAQMKQAAPQIRPAEVQAAPQIRPEEAQGEAQSMEPAKAQEPKEQVRQSQGIDNKPTLYEQTKRAAEIGDLELVCDLLEKIKDQDMEDLLHEAKDLLIKIDSKEDLFKRIVKKCNAKLVRHKRKENRGSDGEHYGPAHQTRDRKNERFAPY
ncbi:MAG: hypothetical protein WB791_01385, partial [Waddliaceae bacterium]